MNSCKESSQYIYNLKWKPLSSLTRSECFCASACHKNPPLSSTLYLIGKFQVVKEGNRIYLWKNRVLLLRNFLPALDPPSNFLGNNLSSNCSNCFSSSVGFASGKFFPEINDSILSSTSVHFFEEIRSSKPNSIDPSDQFMRFDFCV